MPRRATFRALAGIGSALAVVIAAAPAADAARPATARENAAIKRVALKACSAPGGCRWGGAVVSTRNPRFAWGRVVGEGVSGILVRRPRPHGGSFRVAHLQGGGVELCSEWRKHAPRAVLHDLKVKGLGRRTDRVVTCG